VKAFGVLHDQQIQHAITTQSSSDLRALPDSCVDYVFVDPPFGRNLQYSELNQIWESWLRVKTNRDPEAVMDATRKRELFQYSSLMSESFSEMYRVLKSNRWATVVFHNSSNAVWFAIQEALFHAGFVVADVRTLNRESDTYKQIRQGLVKQDLVISCYKPSREIEEKVQLLRRHASCSLIVPMG
jgi:tRNA G10  N-methylase Trm11